MLVLPRKWHNILRPQPKKQQRRWPSRRLLSLRCNLHLQRPPFSEMTSRTSLSDFAPPGERFQGSNGSAAKFQMRCSRACSQLDNLHGLAWGINKQELDTDADIGQMRSVHFNRETQPMGRLVYFPSSLSFTGVRSPEMRAVKKADSWIVRGRLTHLTQHVTWATKETCCDRGLVANLHFKSASG